MSDLSALTAPADPRASWSLPRFGELATVVDLDDVTTRVLAPNPSMMTLDGTNTYVIGDPGHGSVAAVDPGPDRDDHLERVVATLAERGVECELVLVTHHHVDHAEAVSSWSAHFGCDTAAPTRDVAGPDGAVLTPGTSLKTAGLTIDVVATPGHTADHVSFRLPTGAVLTGDHILGRGTSVVVHPDGNLTAYLDSLRRVLALGPDALFPGHGPALEQDPEAVIEYYLSHRRFREQQILTVLVDGPARPIDLVARIYTDVDRDLWPAAEASTRAALDKLQKDGRITWDGAVAAGT